MRGAAGGGRRQANLCLLASLAGAAGYGEAKRREAPAGPAPGADSKPEDPPASPVNPAPAQGKRSADQV
jgi:hypothetical protein